jgi:hypothetical protein
VDALQRTSPNAKIVIYVREGVTAAQLVQEADSRFNVKLNRPIEVRFWCAGCPGNTACGVQDKLRSLVSCACQVSTCASRRPGSSQPVIA